jgi:hypothetical protein
MENSNQYCRKHWFIAVAKNRLGSATVDDGAFLDRLLQDQGGRCPYTGVVLIPGVNCSLDHKMPTSRFPELQHDRDNVQWVEMTVNRIKGAMTPEEFVEMCSLVANRVCAEVTATESHGRAFLDRIIILKINGKSYRTHRAQRKKAKSDTTK